MISAGPVALGWDATALGAAASGSSSGSSSTAGIVSIVIGVVIIIATARWTYLYRQANKPPAEQAPAPPVRRLGADVDWWRENAGGGASPAVGPARPDLTKPTAPGPDQSSTN